MSSLGKQPRDDAIRVGYGLSERWFVPTVWGEGKNNTEWVHTWDEFRAIGGVACFSEDQTELTLSLPAGHKFSIRFQQAD